VSAQLEIFVHLELSLTTSDFVASIAGAVASITVAAPLDVVKTRIQNANFNTNVSGVAVIRDMVRTEGVGAFFKGLTPKVSTLASESSRQDRLWPSWHEAAVRVAAVRVRKRLGGDGGSKNELARNEEHEDIGCTTSSRRGELCGFLEGKNKTGKQE